MCICLNALIAYCWLFAFLSSSLAKSPVFNYPNQILEVNVDEGSKIGSIVAQLKADSGTDPHVNYSMQAWRASVEERNNALFAMDSHGQVTTVSELDLEDTKIHIKPQYKFKVTAMNRDNAESSFCWLLVTINDINDNPPLFGKEDYKFHVSEAVQPKTIVGWVDVTDRDQLDKGKLKLKLVFPKTQHPPHLFLIDPNGRIQTTGKLDREKHEVFNFEVVASDSIGPVHTAKVNNQNSLSIMGVNVTGPTPPVHTDCAKSNRTIEHSDNYAPFPLPLIDRKFHHYRHPKKRDNLSEIIGVFCKRDERYIYRTYERYAGS